MRFTKKNIKYKPSLLSKGVLTLLLVANIITPLLSPLSAAAQALPSNPTGDPGFVGSTPSTGPGAKLAPSTAANVPIEDITGSCNLGLSPSNCILQVLYFFFVTITSWFAAIAGVFFDFAADMSLTSSTYVSAVINNAWVIARDLANMAFVFLLIYLAFQLILNLEGVGVGKSLAKIIAVALLINFSFFFSRVVIDVSNILAHQFYDKIAGPSTISTDPNGVTKEVRGISSNIMEGINVQSLFKADNNAGGSQFSRFVEEQRQKGSAGFGLLAMLFIMFGVMNIILMFVFFAASFQLVARIVVLWIAIILSPLGFVSFAIPGAGGLTSKWWDFLLKNAFFAPAFFLLLYIIVAMVSGTCNASGCSPSILGGDLAASLSTQLSANSSTLYQVAQAMALILLRLALVAGLLFAALKSGEYIGATGASKMASWGKKYGVGTTVGLAAWGARNTVGRGAYVLSRNAALRDAASNNAFARTLWRGARATGSATFDARSLPGAGDLGAGKAGGKGGFAAGIDAKAKNLEKEAKDLKNDAVDKKSAEKRFDANYAKEKGASFSSHIENLTAEIDRAATAEAAAAAAETTALAAFTAATQASEDAKGRLNDSTNLPDLSQQRIQATGENLANAEKVLNEKRQAKSQAEELRKKAEGAIERLKKEREGASKAEDKTRLERFANTLSSPRVFNLGMPSRGAQKGAASIRDLAKGKSATDKIKEAVTELESAQKPEEKPADDKKPAEGGDHK